MECLICSESPGAATSEDCTDFTEHNLQQFITLLKLLQLDNDPYDLSDVSWEFTGNLLCCTCEERIVSVRDLLHQLDQLQFRLEEFRAIVKACICNTYSIQGRSRSGLKLSKPIRDLRDRILAGFTPTEPDADTPLLRVLQDLPDHVVKEEVPDVDMPVLSPCPPPPFDEDFNWSHLPSPASIPSPYPPSPVAALSSPSRKVKRERPRNSSGRRESKKARTTYKVAAHHPDTHASETKHVRIELQRIDELYPELRGSPTATINLKPLKRNTIVQAHHSARSLVQDEVDCNESIDNEFPPPEDVFKPYTYLLPSKCGIPGCRSRKKFTIAKALARHIREVHVQKKLRVSEDKPILPSTVLLHRGKKDNIPPGVKVDVSSYGDDFPTRCKEPGCKSNGFFSKNRLKRHMYFGHIVPSITGPVQRPKQIWEVCSFPVHCPYPDCKLAKKAFHRRFVLKRHITRVHQAAGMDPLNKYKYPTNCPISGCKSEHSYLNKNRLRRHIRTVHSNRNGKAGRPRAGESAYVTGETDAETGITVTESAKLLDELEQISKPVEKCEPKICEVCGLVLATANALISHTRIHTGDFFFCEQCPAKFRTTSGLNQHKLVRHTKTAPVYQCPYCPKTFKVKQFLKVHKWRHTDHRPLACDLCPLRFMFKIEFDEHKRFAHYKELGLEPFDCKICGKMYSRTQYLKHHMKMVHDDDGGRYVCTLCPYRTERGGDFREHVSTVHSSEFPHKCDQCGKSFKLKRRLTEHEKYHQDDYPFQCQICKRKCASARSLRTHLLKKHEDKELANSVQLVTVPQDCDPPAPAPETASQNSQSN